MSQLALLEGNALRIGAFLRAIKHVSQPNKYNDFSPPHVQFQFIITQNKHVLDVNTLLYVNNLNIVIPNTNEILIKNLTFIVNRLQSVGIIGPSGNLFLYYKF